MKRDLREYSRSASSGVKTVASAARRTVGDELRNIKQSLPGSFQQLPPAERRQVIEELRDGLITWTAEIDPVLRDLRALVRELQDEL
jgi:hypothetical protein